MNKNVISFSGIDGCGKSTQIEIITNKWNSKGVKYKIIWARPGSTPGLILAKKIYRTVFRSAPKVGRSEKRTRMLKASNIGKLWLYLSMLEIVFIYAIITRLYAFMRYRVLCDRNFADSLIDYEVMLGAQFYDTKFGRTMRSICAADLSVLFDISIEESDRRCVEKYEPYPDLPEEKKLRYNLYQKYKSTHAHVIIDGSLSKTNITDILMACIHEN